MTKQSGASKTREVGDEAVQARTGRNWAEWFALLDSAGAAQLDHKGIVAILNSDTSVNPWWQQMITVAYERERGLRKVHEKPGGFEISRSKTIAVSLSRLYAAFNDEELRGRWLAESGLRIRKTTENKSMRITWVDGKSSLNLQFYAKGPAKSQIVVQHCKLPDDREAELRKEYWSMQLTKLQTMLESDDESGSL